VENIEYNSSDIEGEEMDIKEQFISLRLDDGLIKDLQKLSEKLDLSRSGCVRLAIERLIEQYLETKADLVVLEKEKWDAIIKMLSDYLKEDILQKIGKQLQDRILKSPEIQKLMKLAKEGKLKIKKKS